MEDWELEGNGKGATAIWLNASSLLKNKKKIIERILDRLVIPTQIFHLSMCCFSLFKLHFYPVLPSQTLMKLPGGLQLLTRRRLLSMICLIKYLSLVTMSLREGK